MKKYYIIIFSILFIILVALSYTYLHIDKNCVKYSGHFGGWTNTNDTTCRKKGCSMVNVNEDVNAPIDDIVYKFDCAPSGSIFNKNLINRDVIRIGNLFNNYK